MIPIGQKKFNRIVIPDRIVARLAQGSRDGWAAERAEAQAEFLPFDLTAGRVLYTEAQLRVQLSTAQPGVSDVEERTALRAFDAYWRGLKAPSRWAQRVPKPQ